MRAYTDRAPGVQLITDPVGRAAPPAPPEVDLSDDDFVPKGLRAWAGRSDNGFHVQGLVDAEGQTYISCVLRGECQTLEVASDKAVEAYDHPFRFGCTLPL